MPDAHRIATILAERRYIHPGQIRDVEQIIEGELARGGPRLTAGEALEPVERMLREMIDRVEAHMASTRVAPAIRKEEHQ